MRACVTKQLVTKFILATITIANLQFIILEWVSFYKGKITPNMN